MALTQGEKLLIKTLTEFPLDEETQEAIFLCLDTNVQQYLMMEYLVTHPEATQEEIMSRFVDILKQTKKSESSSDN